MSLEKGKTRSLTQGEKAWIAKTLREQGYKLKDLLKLLELPRSTYYYEIKKIDAVAKRNEVLTASIIDIFEKHKSRYGVRRVYRELVNMGYKINHKRVQRIMNLLGLKAMTPRSKYRSFKGTVGKIAPNIINRDFKAAAPLMKWSTDVSQFNFTWGKCYLSPIIDMYTNEVISYDLSLSANLSQIVNMMNSAFRKFPDVDGLIMHSDQGWQYQHETFRRMLQSHGIIQSISRKGNCLDNCTVEAFFGRMRVEMYYGHQDSFESFEEFADAVANYMYYYNNVRIQKKTKWMPPTKYRIASMNS